MTDLAKPLADGGWRDIITAPKDGTEILLGRFVPGDKYHGRIRVDWWRSTAARQGFTGFGEFNTSYWPATHWHLLPAPPGAATSPDADRVAVLVEALRSIGRELRQLPEDNGHVDAALALVVAALATVEGK